MLVSSNYLQVCFENSEHEQKYVFRTREFDSCECLQ